ncbi:VirB4 family type IV secretion/conjugal transfer ATPase [Marinicaulis aureus]|uniref:Type IV secretion system protein virB4 n=1 Tax=Hyphococcus aureus TaxID=2666033 RepID=A0ABW1KZ75_9PROT
MGNRVQHKAATRLARREEKAGARLPYRRHLDGSSLLLRDGGLMQTLHVTGLAFETADTEELNHRQAVRDVMLRTINNHQFTLHHHIIRRRVSPSLESAFPDPVSGGIDRLWQARLGERRLFVNELFLTLVYRPKAGKRGLLTRLSAGRATAGAQEAQALKALNGARESLMASLGPYGARLLQCQEEEGRLYSEPLAFLSLLYNGDLQPVLAPSEDCGNYIPYKRTSFGADALEQRGAGQESSSLAAIISVKDYPSVTTPGVIDNLLRLPFELVVSESFHFADRQAAQERIDLALRRLRAADDDTVTLKRGLKAAKDDAASGAAGFGEHHMTVMARAEDMEALDNAAAQTQAALADIGAIAVREDLNLEPSFWAQFPGNEDYIARRAMISTANFAGLCSMHGFPIGAAEDNFWGAPVTIFETTASTPYYFDFHEGDLGNFLMIGPSGSGKTVFLNFLLAQTRKLNSRIIFFDKDRGAEIFLRAIGGHYDILREGEPSGFNPLAIADTPANRAFLRAFIARLVTAPGLELTPEERSLIADAVDSNFEQDLSFRRLRYFVELLSGASRSVSGGLAARMARWHGAGEYAWLFDNPSDHLRIDSPVLGFDMTDILDAPDLRGPAMMYLFHRIGQRLDGARTAIVIDEGWKALDDEVFSRRLKDWLKTIRKRNGIVGFVTQSARDALDSQISATITEQTASQFFLPNPRAQEKEYCGGFGLTAHEFDIVKSLPEQSRCVLIKKGGHSVVARLDLSDLPGVLKILSGREESVRLVDRLRRDHGDDPTAWLPPFLGRDAKAFGMKPRAYREAAE